MLEAIYTALKSVFENRKDAATGTTPVQRYNPPDELLEENVQDLIQATNDMVADAADNNTASEIIAASKKSNVLFSLARDSQSARQTRLQQVTNYVVYLDRALYEADPEDLSDSDGLLNAGIRRVDL